MDTVSREPSLERGRLRTRVTLFFLISSIPAALVSGAAVVVLDRLIADEIAHRTDEVSTSTRLMIQGETERVRSAVDRYVDSPDLRGQLLEPLVHEGEAEDEETRVNNRNGALAAAARSLGLDILALVDARQEPGVILASAHLPSSVGDDAPRLASRSGVQTTTVGFAHELVQGNPLIWAPAIIAARAVTGAGKNRLYLYGGSRLDTHRLESIATNSSAKLVLDSPGLRKLSFPAAGGAAPDIAGDRGGRAILLLSLASGREPTASARAFVNAGDAGAQNRPTRIQVFVDTSRLEHGRAIFATAAIALVLAGLLLALGAGAWLSRRITRPIVELSRAAEEIGAGNLAVRIRPTSNDEVGALVEVFNRMTHELAESQVRLQRAERIAAWREIARRVAHEIKNPLFPIQMAMETLRKGFKTKHAALDDIVEESTRTVLEEVRALNRIVTEFSDFARLPAPRVEPVPPLELLEHVHALYGKAPATSDGVVEVRFDRERIRARALPPIAVDREQIERALINLLKNAVEAMPETGGAVTLDAEADLRGTRSGVRIDVADTGIGMAEEVRQRIFTPYFTTKTEGTGLGLAIVERVVQEHQGTIDVESSEGAGTTFHLWLPAESPASV